MESGQPLETEPIRQRLRPAMRLRDRARIAQVVEARRSASAAPWVVYALHNQLEHPRLCISIRRTVAKAHDRNRIKRCVREMFRLHQRELSWCDYVVTLRSAPPTLRAHLLRPMLLKLFADAARRAKSYTLPPSTDAT